MRECNLIMQTMQTRNDEEPHGSYRACLRRLKAKSVADWNELFIEFCLLEISMKGVSDSERLRAAIEEDMFSVLVSVWGRVSDDLLIKSGRNDVNFALIKLTVRCACT